MSTTRFVSMTSGMFLLASISTHCKAQENPLAIFLFNGGVAADVSGNGVAIAPSLGPTSVPFGYQGGAFRFNGAGQGFRVSLDINPSVMPKLTMGCWVRPTAGNPLRHVLSHDNSGFDRDLGIDTRGGGTGWSAFRGSGVLGYVPVVLDEWVFLAVVYDQTTGAVRLHVGNEVRTGSGMLGTGYPYVDIGKSPCCDMSFEGDIDNVFFIEGALTTERIDEIRIRGSQAIPLCASVWEHPEDASVCPGGAVFLNVLGAGSGDLRYQWRQDGKEIPGATAPTFHIVSANTTDQGVYDCMVTNDCRSVFSDPATVTVCLGDFNCDGAHNSQDLFDFLNAFFAGSPEGDFNGDGAVNSQDFFDFLGVFFTDC